MHPRVIEESPCVIVNASAVGLIVVEAEDQKSLEAEGSLVLRFT